MVTDTGRAVRELDVVEREPVSSLLLLRRGLAVRVHAVAMPVLRDRAVLRVRVVVGVNREVQVWQPLDAEQPQHADDQRDRTSMDGPEQGTPS